MAKWKAGETGNPHGFTSFQRALVKRFTKAMQKDFEIHGESVIERCREEDPAAYLRMIVAMVPKDIALDVGVTVTFVDALKDFSDRYIIEHDPTGGDGIRESVPRLEKSPD